MRCKSVARAQVYLGMSVEYQIPLHGCLLSWSSKTRGLLPLAAGCTYVGCIIGSPSHRHSTHYSLCELRYISMGERCWCLFDRTSLHGVKISPSCMPLSSCNLRPDLFWVCPRMTRHSQFLCFWYYFFGSDKDVFKFSRLTVTVIATKLALCMHQF